MEQPGHEGKHSYTFAGSCSICSSTFNTLKGLNKHIKEMICGGENSFMCKICKKIYSSSSNLKKHLRVHESIQKKYACETCNAKFTERSSLIRHLKNKSNCMYRLTSDLNMICSVCNYSFREWDDLKKHTETMRCGGNDKFTCKTCNKSYSQLGNLKRHEEVHKEKPEKYACETCSGEFTDKGSLKRHLMKKSNCDRRLSKGITSICTICNCLFKKRKDFREHIKTVGCGGKERYLCNICNKSFAHLGSVQVHKETHNSTGKKYVCATCNTEFNQKGHFISHLKSKENCKRRMKISFNSICDVCNSSFPKREDFKLHIKTVQCRGRERFPCDICNKSFAYLGGLKMHKETHESTRQKYVCDACNTEFTQKGHLANHLKRRPNCASKYPRGIRSFCNICKSSFTIREDFRQHIKTAKCGGKERFPCNICNKTFSQSNTLYSHQKTHNGTKKKYICETCNTKFNWKRSLIQHQMKHPNCKQKLLNSIISICSVCKTSFAIRKDFRAHIKITGCGGFERFPCNICNRFFSESGNLKVHQEIHDGTRKTYGCEICNSQFLWKSSLITHRRGKNCKFKLSNSIKRICSVCNSSFTKQGDFKKHIKTAGCGGRERFPCKFCSKSFLSSRYLNKHQKTHSSTREEYVSDSSSAEFTQKSSITRYKRRTAECDPKLLNSVKYTCNICNLPFTKRCDLKKHIETCTGCVEVPVQRVLPVENNPFMTGANDSISALSSSSPQIQSKHTVSPLISPSDYTFKVYVFKNTNSIDFSTFISSKLDEIKNTIRSELELDGDKEIKTAAETGDVKCIEIEGKSEDEVLRMFGPCRSHFIPILHTQEIENSVTLMMEDAMSQCQRET